MTIGRISANCRRGLYWRQLHAGMCCNAPRRHLIKSTSQLT